jgi:murein DD-endopeptidase MepM/ murein hydrolase activator NlpD
MFLVPTSVQTFKISMLIVMFLCSCMTIKVDGEGDQLATMENPSPVESLQNLKIKYSKPREVVTKNPSDARKLSTGDESWRLPYANGTRVYQDQGYNGQFSHQGVYALDMRAPNALVSVARNGWIAAINFDGKWNQWCNSNSDCYNKGGVWRGNHVLVNHADGSTSYYLHMAGGTLQPNLWVGKYVDQGTGLGIQGYTGYTCLDLNTPCSTPDPHVHFQVNANGVSKPTYFEDCNLAGNQCVDGTPTEGTTNTSTNLAPGIANNSRTSKINYFGTNKAIRTQDPIRGQQLKLGYEKETATSSWEWLANGEIRGVNEWCLGAEAGNIILRDCNGKPNQKWVRGVNNSIRNAENGQCWDSYSGDQYDSRVYLWSCHGGANQRWRVGNEPYIAGTGKD